MVFDGENAFEPIIANMIIACKAPVNILYGNIERVNEKSFGQMVIQFPNDATSVEAGVALCGPRG